MSAPTIEIFSVSGASPGVIGTTAITTQSWDYAVIPTSGNTVLSAKSFVYKFTNNSASELKLYLGTSDGHGLTHPFQSVSTYVDPSTISSTTIQTWNTLSTAIPTNYNINSSTSGNISAGSYSEYIYGSLIVSNTVTSGNNVLFTYRLSFYFI